MGEDTFSLRPQTPRRSVSRLAEGVGLAGRRVHFPVAFGRRQFGNMASAPDGAKIPSSFVCPISMEIMSNPVMVSTGHTYDCTSITRWLKDNRNNRTCPVTGLKLANAMITPNFSLRNAIQVRSDAPSPPRLPPRPAAGAPRPRSAMLHANLPEGREGFARVRSAPPAIPPPPAGCTSCALRTRPRPRSSGWEVGLAC
mmetsp:Transcript_40983/g.131013  ORF Transcript_40983/g.131013 Transcript_40983/m.131013 type:complete len:198 (+) Transcript_40983:51-644(+)